MSRLLQELRSKILTFEGPVVATVTPSNQTGKINCEIIGKYASRLRSIGVRGAFIHGTTGEAFTLTNAEKMSLTREWAKHSHSLLTIINVSSTSASESIEHARLCEELAVDAIAMLPHIYYRPKDESELVEYLKLIASAAPNTPLIYYHFPACTHVELNLTKFVLLALREIPSFVGMKYTSGDIIEVQRVLYQFKDSVKIFMGFEETLLPALVCGANAAICALFNLAECTKAYDVMRDVYVHDLHKALEEQKRLALKFKDLSQEGHLFINVRKALKDETNGEISAGAPRPPLSMN
ncbi:dihydrodipicolinate synthase-like protein [Dinothrombium tinctorium]|uniref:N-acetylneuraminate lyase n=1 Tax=Dinothrombium tinctorium TaxID=1965070 RepID=A0A443R7T1_9ACAR|nr:dihydrodipicolinate synthase-like protein [Dinothrombium tinctorium]